jgi:hypothetical protein
MPRQSGTRPKGQPRPPRVGGALLCTPSGEACSGQRQAGAPAHTWKTRRSAASAASVRAADAPAAACRGPDMSGGRSWLCLLGLLPPPHASDSKESCCVSLRPGSSSARGREGARACQRGTRRRARLRRARRGVAHVAPGCSAVSPVPIRLAEVLGRSIPCPPRRDRHAGENGVQTGPGMTLMPAVGQ